MIVRTLVVAGLLGAMLGACSRKPVAPVIESTSGAEATELDAALIPIPNARLTDRALLIGGQPSPEHLKAIAAAGYRTVISLRAQGEPGSEGERDAVETLGMRFVSIPVHGADGLTPQNAQALAIELAAIDTAPAVLHCGTGNRAAALLGLKEFLVDGVEADDAIEFAQELGMTSLESALRQVMQQLCDADAERDCDITD